MELVFVTGSQQKFREAAAILPNLVQHAAGLPEIQESNVDAVLLAKVEAAKKIIVKPFFVEDVSLIFDALAPFPGTFIKWFVRDLGTARLADLAMQLGNTKARAVCSIGVWIEGKFLKFEGTVSGRIVLPRGEHGFGWDPIFCPDGSQLTFAEMADWQKQEYSMRAVALHALKNALGL